MNKKTLTLTIIFCLFLFSASSVFAIPGKSGDKSKAEDNAAVEFEDDQSLVTPTPATNKRVIKKVLPSEDTKEPKSTPPGQGGTPPGQEDDGGDDTDDGDDSTDDSDNTDDSTDVESGLTGTLGATTTASTSKYAIVVGICNYPGEENDICWSDGDSLNMYEALTQHYGFEEDNVIVLRDMVGNGEPFHDPDCDSYDPDECVTDGAATAGNIDAAISHIEEQIEEDDEVVFFFSGHGGEGTIEEDGEEKTVEGIIAHNGDDKIKYIWDIDLRDRFDQEIGSTTDRISFVFDSCLAGGMDDVAADGRVVSMATDDKQPASVYSTGSEKEDDPGEGVFTHYFVNEGILQGGADTVDHDDDDQLGESSDVVVEEAFEYADDNISGRQKPTLSDNFPYDLLW